jgi:hypothetical protein
MTSVFAEWFAARRGAPLSPDEPLPPGVAHFYPDRERSLEVANPLSWREFASSVLSAPDTCPGPTGISAAAIRKLPLPYLHGLWRISNLCLTWEALPQAYNTCYIYPIAKKGTPSLSNSRPIALLETALKTLTRAIAFRLKDSEAFRGYISPCQFGFMPGRSSTDPYHTLLGAAEDAKEGRKDIHVCLVDLTKAFDSLSPYSMSLSYKAAGLTPHSAAFLGSLDGTGTAQVLT